MVILYISSVLLALVTAIVFFNLRFGLFSLINYLLWSVHMRIPLIGRFLGMWWFSIEKWRFFFLQFGVLNHISEKACFAVSRLISCVSSGRGWTGSFAIPSWCYYPLYQRVTVHSSQIDYMSAEFSMSLGTELCIALSSKRVLTEHSWRQYRVLISLQVSSEKNFITSAVFPDKIVLQVQGTKFNDNAVLYVFY